MLIPIALFFVLLVFSLSQLTQKKETVHAVILAKTSDTRSYSNPSIIILFQLDDGSRISLSEKISTSSLWTVGDRGLLTYRGTFLVSFVLDKHSPITSTSSTHPDTVSSALVTIISIVPESDTSRVLFEFIDKHRVSLNLPRSQADLLAPGDKGTLVYEDSTFVSFTRA